MHIESSDHPYVLSSEPISVGFVLHVMQVAGAEVLVAETIRMLGSRIRPTIFCLDAVGPLGEQLAKEGIEVIELNRRPGRDWKLASRLAGQLATRRIELLHAHQYTPFFYSALAKRLVQRPPWLILTEHGRHFPDIVSRARFLTNRYWLSGQADAITSVCNFSLRGLSDVDGFNREKIRVIENGIEFERYGLPDDRIALRRRLGLDPARIYVACIARFHPVKDQATLLRAFRIVAMARPNVDLLLIGDGPLRGELEGQAASMGIADRVNFLGMRRDVPDLLRASDVFALTSISEAASLTLLEAMASSLPVVVTNVGGNPEIVRAGRDGLLVPRGDADATASALITLLGDPALAAKMGQSGRDRVEEKYRLDRTIEAYHNLYLELCRPGRNVDSARRQQLEIRA